MKKGDTQPEDHIRCSECNVAYGFIKCRVTLNEHGRRINVCLTCATKR